MSAGEHHGVGSAEPSIEPDEKDIPLPPSSGSNVYTSTSIEQVHFFDPEGIPAIRRSLTRLSETLREDSQHGNHLGPNVDRIQSHESSHTQTSVDVNQAEFTDNENLSDSDLTLNNVQVNDGSFDFERFLKNLVRRLGKTGVNRPRELGVLFRNLRVTAPSASTATSLPEQLTVGSIIDRLTLPFKPRTMLSAIQSFRHPEQRKPILSGFEGVVRPGEMLLVLGRPGAGCSTFLRALSSHPSLDELRVHGTLVYDSITSPTSPNSDDLPEPLPKSYRGDLHYSPEDDEHLPTLTVEQTLQFSAYCRMPAAQARPPPSSNTSAHLSGGSPTSRKLCVDLMVEVLLTIFGLRHVRKTIVGNEWIRGVSGGQRKRVSIAEAMAGRARLGCWDNSTRGLDSSTALEFVQSLKIATDAASMTTILALYQAGEPLYELFDKVCILYEGRMAYFGKASEAKQYFIDMGYQPKNRQTTADFLVAVTDPNGRTVRPGFEGRVPRTADEFAEYFLKSDACAANRADMAAFEETCVGKPERALSYRTAARAEHVKRSRQNSPYVISVPMQVRALMKRRVQVMRGDKLTAVANFVTYLVQALIMGTVFFRLKNSTSAFYSRGGVLYFAILLSALITMAEIPALFSQRPVVLRQSHAAMYHPFGESLARTLVDIPISFVTLIAFTIPLYFLAGLQETAGQFFIFYLFVFVMTITMMTWFRALSAVFRSAAPAQTLGGMSILVFTLYTGYTIPVPSMIGALRWINHLNPLKYGFEALMVNELHKVQAECATLIPQGPGYDGHVTLANQVCTSLGSEPGRSLVSGNRYVEISFGYSYSHLWRNFGIICGFGIGFIAAYLTFTQLNTKAAGQTSVTLFKRGARAVKASLNNTPRAADIENHVISEKRSSADVATVNLDSQSSREKEPVRDSVIAAPAMTDVFSWQHLEYTVPLGDGTYRRLLDDVSGFVAPGKLTALMGESGAGKTTLLNVLAERQDVGVVRGDRFVNGQALPQDFQAQTGYCQQLDTHLATSTVREALLFSAKMRQPQSVPLADKEAYVEKCLAMCGLVAYADAIVGTLNVEHRKRTTIAVELVAKPRLLLFLDEPTSGLDSQSAWAIVAFLRELADNAGQAILCTIHQPSGELFQVFDRLLLLRTGGQTVYFGDIGNNSTTMLSYFERNGARPCGADENPAEYILHVIGAGATATADRDWHSVWLNSTEKQESDRQIEEIHAEGRKRPPVETKLKSEFATTWWYQVVTLFQRDCEAHWRNPTFIMAKISMNIVSGLFIGFTFFKSKDTLQGTQNKLFSIFMALVMSVPLAQQLQVPFLTMRNMYEIRERPSRMYSWTALITSQLMAEIPWNILGSSLFYFCWYWTVGFSSEGSRAGYAYLMLGVAFPLYYTTVGQAIAAMAPNMQIAALLFSALFSFVLIFNGVLQPYASLGWWKWMYRVSPFSYFIEGLLTSVIGHEKIACASVEFVEVNPPAGATCTQYLQPFINVAGGYLTNPNATSACTYCPFDSTDQFLSSHFSMEYTHRWRDMGITAGFIVFNIFAIYVLTYMFRIRSGNPLAPLKRYIESRKSKK